MWVLRSSRRMALGGQEEAAVYDTNKGSDIAQQERDAPEEGAVERVQRCEWRLRERVRAGEAHKSPEVEIGLSTDLVPVASM